MSNQVFFFNLLKIVLFLKTFSEIIINANYFNNNVLFLLISAIIIIILYNLFKVNVLK